MFLPSKKFYFVKRILGDKTFMERGFREIKK